MLAVKTVLLFCALGHCQDYSDEESQESQLAESETKMSESILAILEHFKQPDPVGLPGAEIPEPYPVPDMKKSISFGSTVYFKNTAVHGISKFKIVHLDAEIATMKMQAVMSIDHLNVRGNYTMSTLLSETKGPFTVEITGLIVNAKGSLGVERDGMLRVQEIAIDLSFTTINANFENLSIILQGIINTAGSFLFDTIKPYILKEAYSKVRTEVNIKLEKFTGDMQFPNSISPLDMIVSDFRKKLEDMGFDPYKMDSYNTTVSLFTISLDDTLITGLSSIQRVGNISLEIENSTVIADFEIGTQRLEGRTQWDISALQGLLATIGTASFSVEYITARIILGQPLDTRKRIEFRNLNLEIGNIQVRCDGAGTLDYAIEFLVNILPNLLRYQIMNSIEGPIKEKIQQELNTINTEEEIKSNLPKISSMQKFRLSGLRNADENYDEDDFFNF